MTIMKSEKGHQEAVEGTGKVNGVKISKLL